MWFSGLELRLQGVGRMGDARVLRVCVPGHALLAQTGLRQWQHTSSELTVMGDDSASQ